MNPDAKRSMIPFLVCFGIGCESTKHHIKIQSKNQQESDITWKNAKSILYSEKTSLLNTIHIAVNNSIIIKTGCSIILRVLR